MTNQPRSSAKPPSTTPQSDSLSEGKIVHYEDDGHPILAVVIGFRKDKYVVQNIRGREVELIRNRIHVTPGGIPSSSNSAKGRVTYLEDLLSKVEPVVASINLDDVWEVVITEPRAYGVSELTTLYFGKDELISHVAMRTALIREKTYFKRDRDLFEPRPENVVADLKRAESSRREKLRFQELMVSAFERRIKNKGEPFPDGILEYVQLLEELAANSPHLDQGRQKDAKDLLELCLEKISIPQVGTLEEKAYVLLELVGHFHRDTNLSILRHKVPVEFSPQALSEANSISQHQNPTEYLGVKRQDLTGLFTFTVDDLTTMDMDDAISFRQTEDGYELGIHITDVAAILPPDSALDVEARRRASSIYCADRTINMFPETISERMASLVVGQVRPCLSCIVHLSQRLEIQRWEIHPSNIKVSKRYSYDDVDRLLDEDDITLSKLYEFSASHESWRIENGASRVQKRDAVPIVEEDGSIRLLEIDEASPARMLVAECMVIMNRFVAEYCAEHHLPVLFRGQERAEQPEDDNRSVHTPEGPAKDFAARTKLRKSVTSLDPLPHASLGLNAYLQSTSPIRRYMDLCHQRQILSFMLKGEPWLPREAFEQLAREVEHSLEAATLVGRETKRYWLTRYLEERGKKKNISGTVVRTDTKLPLVELDEVYITIFARSFTKIKVGDLVEVKLTNLDARQDYLRAEVVKVLDLGSSS